MKKLISLSLILFSIAISLHSQEERVSNNFENYRSVINPAYVGMDDNISLTAISNFGSSALWGIRPSLNLFKFEMPIDEISSGVGINLSYQTLFFENLFIIDVPYSYIFKFEKSELGVGVAPSYVSQRVPGVVLGVNNDTIDSDLDV